MPAHSAAATARHTASDDVLYEVKGSVGFLTFNRPAQRNALTFGMYSRLAEICAAADGTGPERAIVITGAGDRAFAAGTDIAQFRGFRTQADALNYEAEMDRVLGTLERCGVPTIAAITGACTGGGGAIAAACDIRIATRSLKFGFPIARTLGNCLSAGNLSRLAALLGAARTKEILFTSRLIEIEEAKACGLVNEIVEDSGHLMVRAEELASTIAGNAPLTLRATKEALRRLRERAADVDDTDLITLCYTSEDFREGMEAFLAKRKPEWKGR